MKKFFLILSLFLTFLPSHLEAQTVIEIDPLFEYPVAPEELESIQDKCNYLVKNFWNNFNFKKKEPVDQYALNEAFQVYTSTFQFASDKELNSSLDKLIKNLSGNPMLLMQFVKAAEENLYGPRADYWYDEIYLRFLEAIIKNKKIDGKRKTKYISQEASLRNSLIGAEAPSFSFQDINGESKKYFPMSTPTLIIFGNPENTDWRLIRLKMDTNFQLEDALKKGKVNILFILPNKSDNWIDNVSNYNSYWSVGQSDEVKSIYDIRFLPSIYVIDSNGKILNKNLNPEVSVNILLDLVK